MKHNKKHVLKALLLSLALGASGLLAMEPTTQKAKRAELGPQPMEIEGEKGKGEEELGQALMEIETITLVSAEGKEFELPARVAKRSGQIADLMSMPGQERVEFKQITTQVFEILVHLLSKLDELLQHNESVEPDKQIYVPRAFQPFVDEHVANLKNEQLVEILHAVKLLDVPFIINAIAAVIASRVYEQLDLKKRVEGDGYILTRPKLAFEQLESLQQVLQKEGFIEVPEGVDRYVLKHVEFRKCGIQKEYSIADYIAEHGQPELIKKYDFDDSLYLANKKLTSLFGINMLQNGKNAQNLWLNENCFFDFNLDVQGVQQPFAGLAQLQRFTLANNKLINLPATLFAGLAHLLSLSLKDNQLINLPATLFAGLPQLQELYLDHNEFVNLPEGLFAGLAQLRWLRLNSNQLSDATKQQIKEELPNVEIKF